MIQYGDAYQFNPPKNGDTLTRSEVFWERGRLESVKSKYNMVSSILKAFQSADWDNLTPEMIEELGDLTWPISDFIDSFFLTGGKRLPYYIETSRKLVDLFTYWAMLIEADKKLGLDGRLNYMIYRSYFDYSDRIRRIALIQNSTNNQEDFVGDSNEKNFRMDLDISSLEPKQFETEF